MPKYSCYNMYKQKKIFVLYRKFYYRSNIFKIKKSKCFKDKVFKVPSSRCKRLKHKFIEQYQKYFNLFF